MSSDEWREGLLYDDQGECLMARISYRLSCEEGLDGFPDVAGPFVLREEACPLHTGLVQLIAPEGARWLARVLRISRPGGDGELEVVESLGANGDRQRIS